jgi:tetratricopeptide (TPR) repeat protein
MTALRDFLLGLFTASYPERPRGELPTTAELLAEGARQAGSGEIADPLVRSEMLGTLGQIYFARGLTSEAEPLLDQAAAVMPADAPREVRERLLRAQGDLAEARGDIATAVARYDAAIALYASTPDDPAGLALEGKRGFLELQRNDPAAASARLGPLLERMQRLGLPLREQRRVLGALVIALARERRYDEAQAQEHRLIELTRELEGPDSRAMAMVHGNAIGLAVRLGDFAAAERHARQAIAIYDRIFDTASQMRAGARTALGDTLRYAGRFDEALAVYDDAFAEQASFLGVDGPQQLPQYRISRGRALAYAERCAEAVVELREADRLLRDRPGANPVERPEALALLARCACQSGDATAGRAALAQVDPSVAAAARDLDLLREDAEAECALARGDSGAALAHWERAEQLQRDAPPGDAGTYARHALRRASLLQSLGRVDDAVALRAEVRRRLQQVNLEAHPLFRQTDPAVVR